MIAICVGHSRTGDRTGALSVDGVSEWDWNYGVGMRLVRILSSMDIEAVLISRYPRVGYTAAITWLDSELNRIGATAAIELHFNSSDDPSSHGNEWLHWHSSLSGKRLAQSLERNFKTAFVGSRQRGLVPISSDGQRGGQFLRRTPCPAVICEPFFGSNRNEWASIGNAQERYATALATGLKEWKGAA